MNGWLIAAIVVAIFVTGTVVLNYRLRRKHEQLAALRTSHDETSFIEAMVKERVSATTATFLWDELQFYYFRPLKPALGDKLFSTLRIDSEDLEDIAIKFCKVMRLRLPDLNDPVAIPEDQSVAEFGRFLDEQAILLANLDQ